MLQRTITIQPKAVLCAIQPVNIEQQPTDTSSTSSILEQVEITERAYIDSLAVNPTVIPSQEEDIPDTETVDWAAAQAMDTTIKSLIKLSHAYQLAAEASKIAQANQKEGYDLRVRGAAVQKGDRVLVKIVAFDGKHKLADTWEDTPYVVIDQPNLDIPVFTVVKENGEGRTRNLHRNLLLPVGYIREETPTVIPKPVPRPRTRLQRTIAEHRTTSSESSDESSDESVDYFDVDYVLERTVDSEPTFTDEPAVDVTEPAQDAFIPLGDAQPEGNQGPEMETASGSASDIVGEVIPQEDTLVEQEEQPQELEMSPVPVRRSGRDRKPPAWISSGLYDISAIGTTSVGHTITEEHSKPTAEWQEKAEYITSLARTPLFSGLQREAALAILDIVNHH
ncbi:Hypothetical predicted protein [Mytilus galloprovincialis]|uniref:Uncharacterized protein n=1 Tax=Mytilus galloprovincialis TaxID=29158 RepID=A0A8B6BSF9_MYTGA|nr:Hypothetical predicted protein [Mytilus galloprovincialis]